MTYEKSVTDECEWDEEEGRVNWLGDGEYSEQTADHSDRKQHTVHPPSVAGEDRQDSGP